MATHRLSDARLKLEDPSVDTDDVEMTEGDDDDVWNRFKTNI
jgi:hypothetical protein